jgi:hypothetical protein
MYKDIFQNKHITMNEIENLLHSMDYFSNMRNAKNQSVLLKYTY